jgi:tRNA (uracil-5-)-methyltransferase TRM9
MTQKISNYNNFAKEWDQTRKHAWGEFEFAQKLLPANNILDAGCGNGRLVNWLRQNKFTGKYLGIDISSKLIKIAKKNFPKEKFEIADLRNFQQAKQFDTIFSIATLHHITNPSEQKQVLKNLYISLKPKGQIFLTTWNLWQPRFWKYFLQQFSRNLKIPFGEKNFRYVHAFRKNELRNLLQQTGFKNIKIFYARHTKKTNFLIGRNLIAIASS